MTLWSITNTSNSICSRPTFITIQIILITGASGYCSICRMHLEYRTSVGVRVHSGLCLKICLSLPNPISRQFLIDIRGSSKVKDDGSTLIG